MITTATTSSSSEIIRSLESVEHYYKDTVYYKILDSITGNLKKMFSPESLALAVSVDEFMKLEYEGSLIFIDHYKVGNFRN